MFFEGIEKKAEIIVNPQLCHLLDDMSDEFWQAMVECCGARILSHISNGQCKALLLSESSLLVWPTRLLIVTCGETKLVQAVEYFLANVAKNVVLQVIYQRKNEHVSRVQSSHFFDDIKRLDGHMLGKAYRFGQLHDHHNYLYHMDNAYKAPAQLKTYELLAYQIGDEACALFTQTDVSAAQIRQFLQLSRLLPGFVLDDHVFEPFGYSLNAIKDDSYLTIHVTPQASSSYVSFEANFDLMVEVAWLLQVLKPTSFDLVGFNVFDFADKLNIPLQSGYIAQSLVKGQLSNGFEVCFGSFFKPKQDFSCPVLLNLKKDNYIF